MVELLALLPKPIVMVMSTDPEYGKLILIAGADAFVNKGEYVDWITEKLKLN
jgi:hypothetical protein